MAIGTLMENKIRVLFTPFELNSFDANKTLKFWF